MQNVFFILLGLALLILGGGWLLKSAVALSLRLNISRIIIGMTVVSLATSAPELIVSVTAAVEGFPDIALGNVVGSNIANLGLILGVVLLLAPIEVRKSFYTVDWPVMMVSSLLVFSMIFSNGIISRQEGVILVVCLFLFLIFLLRFQQEAVVEDVDEAIQPLPLYKAVFFLGIGGLGLWGGSEFLITGSVELASYFGVSDRIIGITVVSVGTSIPELSASVIALIKKEKAISLGNLIGSNIFNLLAVLGITSVIRPIMVIDQGLLTNDIFWMLGFAFIVLPLVFLPKGLRLNANDGVVLLLAYAAFVYFTLF